MITYNDVYSKTRRRLRDAGVTMAELEARLILSRVTGLAAAEFLRDARLLEANRTVEDGADALVTRRENGEPIAYILGEWEFYGLPVTVTPSVLIPRADTETLAEAAIKAAHSTGGRVLDLCAGSGCVGLAIAANTPGCGVVLADISDDALDICRTNILRNGLAPRVTCVKADARAAPPDSIGTFGVIACNPPYIPSDTLETLDRSVREFEPRLALDGGGDGLDFFRKIAGKWRAALSDTGVMLFECGAGQARDVQSILDGYGFTDTAVIYDAKGYGRVVIGGNGG